MVEGVGVGSEGSTEHGKTILVESKGDRVLSLEGASGTGSRAWREQGDRVLSLEGASGTGSRAWREQGDRI